MGNDLNICCKNKPELGETILDTSGFQDYNRRNYNLYINTMRSRFNNPLYIFDDKELDNDNKLKDDKISRNSYRIKFDSTDYLQNSSYCKTANYKLSGNENAGTIIIP